MWAQLPFRSLAYGMVLCTFTVSLSPITVPLTSPFLVDTVDFTSPRQASIQAAQQLFNLHKDQTAQNEVECTQESDMYQIQTLKRND